jgi:hypothetical protein
VYGIYLNELTEIAAVSRDGGVFGGHAAGGRTELELRPYIDLPLAGGREVA